MRIISNLIKAVSANEGPAPINILKSSSGNYCINLKSQPQRLKEVKRQLGFYGIEVERFSAVLSKNVVDKITRKERVRGIANGCLQSHIDLYKEILAKNQSGSGDKRPFVAVFEDDIVVLSTITELDAYAAQLPDDWDFVYLGGNYHFHKPVIINEHLIRPVYALSTHAQLIRIDFLPRLIEELEKREFEVDVVYCHLQERGVGNWYGFTTDFFWQHGLDSAAHTSLWRHQLGLFHYSMANRVIDQVVIKNYLP